MGVIRRVCYGGVVAGWAAFLGWLVAEKLFFPSGPGGGMLQAAMFTGTIGAAIGLGGSLASGMTYARWKQLLGWPGWLGWSLALSWALALAFVGVIGGCLGGALGSVVGDLLYSCGLPGSIRWLVIGLGIGGAERFYRVSWSKTRNGLLGGGIGGLLGGALFHLVPRLVEDPSGMSSRAISFVVLAICIGAFSGLAQVAQVALREVWLTVVDGSCAGLQVVLSQPVTVLGRGEHLPLPFLGRSNADLELEHARIVRRRDGRYVIEDIGSSLGTYLNGRRIQGPTPLEDGDVIKLGSNMVRFNGQRRKSDRVRPAMGPVPGPPPPPPPPPRRRVWDTLRPVPPPPPLCPPCLPGIPPSMPRNLSGERPPTRVPTSDLAATPATPPVATPIVSSPDAQAGPPTPADEFGPVPSPVPPPNTGKAVDENVQFTVFRPKSIPPEVWCNMVASAHLEEKRPDAPADEPEPLERARAKAQAALKDLGPEDIRESIQDSSQAVPQGGQITFVPQIEGVRFNPPQHSFLWEEDEHTVVFRMLASAALDGKVARGRMTVFLGAIIVADVPLRIEVDRSADERETKPTKPVPVPRRRIFASYSHCDLAIVEQFERYAEASGDEYLRDWKNLRPGDRWNDKLLAMIDQADIFQLFWSSNAMQSEFVRREWEHALRRNQEGFVRPVYWEEPFPSRPPDLPPPALAQLHFQRIGGGFGCHVPSTPTDAAAALWANPGPAYRCVPPLRNWEPSDSRGLFGSLSGQTGGLASGETESVSELASESTKPRLRCPACGTEFVVEHWPSPACPRCGRTFHKMGEPLLAGAPAQEPAPPVASQKTTQAKRRRPSPVKVLLAGAVATTIIGLVSLTHLSTHAPSDRPWEEISRLVRQHKWAQALRKLEKFESEFPEDPHAVQIPFIRDMCGAGPEVYDPYGDPEQAYDLLRAVARKYHDNPGYERHREDVCLALAHVVERFVTTAVRDSDPEKLARAREAFKLLSTEGRDLNEPSIREKGDELARRIAEAENAIRARRPK